MKDFKRKNYNSGRKKRRLKKEPQRWEKEEKVKNKSLLGE
jgi:hypothetical protein